MDAQNPKPEFGMKWHKFLIYFSLWAGAALNGISALAMITETQYGSNRVMVYMVYPSMRTVDVLFGLLLIAVSVYTIYTRFQLARFKIGAPRKLNWVYALSLTFSLLYLAVAAAVIGLPLGDMMDSDTWATIPTSIAMMVVNSVYYGKRSELFVN